MEPDKWPALKAVCENDPAQTLRHGARAGADPALAGVTPLHIAAVLGRDRCCRALLDAGVDPSPWTLPPSATAGEGPDGDGGAIAAAAAGGEAFASYESVCSSPVYRELKALLPPTSEFAHTFALAQVLLRAPCTPLMLATRFGKQAAARILLNHMHQQERRQGRQQQHHHHQQAQRRAQQGVPSLLGAAAAAAAQAGSRQSELDAALALWSAGPDPQLSLLRRLLSAGADPLESTLPAILQRYSNCSLASALAEKMRQGMQAVLEHVLPSPAGDAAGSSSSSSSSIRSAGSAGASNGTPGSPTSSAPGYSPALSAGWQRVAHCAGHLRTLLSAAVACKEASRCEQLLAALASPGLDVSPWANPALNAALLVSAAGHDMPGVVRRLLALPPLVPGGATPPFQPNMWGEDGLSALMAAAHRGSLAALGALLEAGATVNLADELGATALHWAVVGGQEGAVMLLAQHGAGVDHMATVHEEEEHLERPLLTATHAGNLPMMRLLHQLGASLDLPTPGGYTPLSVAVCWEQLEATRLLLSLGADPNQVLPAHINGGFYQLWSENYSIEETRSLLGMCCSRLEWREFVELLLQSGADPTLRHPQTGHTPAAEVAAFGAIEEASVLIELSAAPKGPWSLEQLGWADAVAEAARNFYFYACANPSEDLSLVPLLAAWHAQQPPPAGPPPPAACRTIVASLLRHPALTLREGVKQLATGAELAGVQQAERLASLGIYADMLEGLEASPCRAVLLAAAPPAVRWSPSRHAFFPPAFKQAARQLLLVNRRLQAQAATPAQRQLQLRRQVWELRQQLQQSLERRVQRVQEVQQQLQKVQGAQHDLLTQAATLSLEKQQELEQALQLQMRDVRELQEQAQQDLRQLQQQQQQQQGEQGELPDGPGAGPVPAQAEVCDACSRDEMCELGYRLLDVRSRDDDLSETEQLSDFSLLDSPLASLCSSPRDDDLSEPEELSNFSPLDSPLASLCSSPRSSSSTGSSSPSLTDAETTGGSPAGGSHSDGAATSRPASSSRGLASAGTATSRPAGSRSGSGLDSHGVAAGGPAQESVTDSHGAAAAVGALPQDAIFELLRHLAAAPLSFWMRQPAAAERALTCPPAAAATSAAPAFPPLQVSPAAAAQPQQQGPA